MEITPFLLPDVAAWRAWLDANEMTSDGVWLVLAKKGTTTPTALTYDQALDEALCSGWIDGQVRSRDAATYLQRFTPRRARSMWSQRNVGIVGGLIEAGRMRERGFAEIERAQADGRWDRAYPGAASAELPEDLVAALGAEPGASDRWAALPAAERFPLMLAVFTAATPATRARRVAAAVKRVAQ